MNAIFITFHPCINPEKRIGLEVGDKFYYSVKVGHLMRAFDCFNSSRNVPNVSYSLFFPCWCLLLFHGDGDGAVVFVVDYALMIVCL